MVFIIHPDKIAEVQATGCNIMWKGRFAKKDASEEESSENQGMNTSNK